MNCRRCYAAAVLVLALTFLGSWSFADTEGGSSGESVLDGSTMVPLGAAVSVVLAVVGAASSITKKIEALTIAVAAVDTKIADLRLEMSQTYASKGSVSGLWEAFRGHEKEFAEFRGGVNVLQMVKDAAGPHG